MKHLRLLLVLAAVLLPFAVGAQVYVSDYSFSTYNSSFTSISSTGTELTLNTLNSSQQITLPFTFPFGQESCTTLTVGSNGQIGIGSANPSSGSSYSAHTTDMSIISPLAANYNMNPYQDGTGHVYYETRGTAPNRSVVIEYNDPAIDTTLSNTLIFQAVLYENGDVEFIYDTCQLAFPRTVYVFMREHNANKALSIAGPWSAPTVSQTIASRSISPTSFPAQGLTLSFTREERSCLRPLNFVCRSSARVDSIYLAWNPAPATGTWELRYDTIGTPVDSMLHIQQYITDSFYVCTDLSAGGVYEAYLRTDCGAEMSFWEGPVLITPGAYNMPATGYNTIYACGGTIYDDGGATGNYSPSCNSTLVVMPSSEDSAVVVDIDQYTESGYDYLYIFDGIGTSGTPLYEGSGGPTTVSGIRSLSGPLTVQFVSDPSVQRSGFSLSVRCVEAPRCRVITQVDVAHVAGASAYLSWTVAGMMLMPSEYLITLYNRTDTTQTPIVYSATELYYFLSGLAPQTDYMATVSSVCGEDTIFGDSVHFRTLCLSGGMSNPSGLSNQSISGVPVYTSYGNTFCQSIYTAAELGAMGVRAGAITGITYTWSSAGSYTKDIIIFLGQTNNSTFSSFSPLAGCMTQVYSGTRTPSDVGTVEYTFNTPFMWDGVSNLVLSSFVNQPSGESHYSSGFTAYSTNCSVTRTIYGYKDNVAYTTSNISTNTSTNVSAYRPNVRFISPCDTLATCVAPNAFITEQSADSVKLMWAPGNTETAWDVKYRAESDTSWTVVYSNISQTSCAIGNLAPMTTYQIRVVPNCGADTIAATLSVTTPCSFIMDLPFTENFESFTASSTIGSPITPCWHRGTSYTYSSYPYLTTSTPYSGNYCMYIYGSASAYSYLALPGIGHDMDSLQISFAARFTGSNYVLKVGVMTDPEDINTITQVGTVTPTATSTWELFEVPLASGGDHGQYIVLYCNGSLSYCYLDNIEVNYIPSCQRPRQITSSNITTTTASLHWSAPGANYFEIEYGPAGFAHGSGNIVTSSADSVTLYGLNHSTRYEVYVRGLCTATDTSFWSFPHYFNTECDEIDMLPVSFTFAGYGTGSGVVPNCWTCGGYSSYPYITVATPTGGLPTPALYMYTFSANQTYASLPRLDSVTYPVNITQVYFRAWTPSVNDCYIVAGVCSQPGDLLSFTPADTVVVTNTPTLFEVAFDNVAGAGTYITLVSSTLGGTSTNVVYVDSVAIDLIPSCQKPNHLHSVGVTATTADIAWNERNLATTWEVEYGSHGFVLGTGTRLTTTTNPLSLSGLNPSTSYDFYVRSICSTTDTSDWSIDVGNFNTRQNPGVIPYFYDFESPLEWENWQTNSNTNVNWYRDTAATDGTPGYNTGCYYSMFVSADSGRTYGTDLYQVVNATAYRDFDFGPVDSSFSLTFRARAGGTPSAGYDALMVFLVDPNIPVVASSSNITSPWGSVLDLTPLATVRVNNYWNTYTVTLDALSGVHRLAFFWFNQSTASTPYQGGSAAVDNISIDYIACPRPANVNASQISMTTATLEWDGEPVTADYRYYCRSALGAIAAEGLIHTNRIHITNLDPGTRYNMIIRRLCSATDSSALSLNYSFVTKQCNDGFIDTIGDPSSTSTTYMIPTNNYWKYSYCQQIIPASEISGPGEISAINFRYAYSTATTVKTNCTIYMGHTTLSSFADVNSFVAPDSMQLVYIGNLNCTPDWNRFMFNYSFNYNGVDNLVIAIDDNSGELHTTSHTFYMSPTTDIRSVVYYSDTENPNVTSRATLDQFHGQSLALAYVNQMVLELCPPTLCPTPILCEPVIRPDSVTLRWRNTGRSYQVGYRLATSSSWIVNSLSVGDTFYTIHNIFPMTDYVYQVRQYCDSTGVSNWALGSFNSGDIPCLEPTGLQVSSVTHNKVTLRWTPEENHIAYRVHVFNSILDKYVNSYLSNKTVTGLEPNTIYYAAVQATCQDMEDPSQWTDTISFTTDYCPDATNLRYSDLQGNSVVLDWTEGGRATQWEIEYGYSGFDQGTGFSVVTDTHPYTLTGLIGENTYDIYVRAICGNNFYSENWSNVVTITTPFSSIDGVGNDARVKLSPNPTSGDVTIELPATSGSATVEVLDATGRVMFSTILTAGTETALLKTSQLAQGAYFVRITGDSIHAIRKLIVR